MSTLPFTSYLFCYVEYAKYDYFQYLTNTIKFVELPFKDHMLVQISSKSILEKTANKSVAALAVIINAYALLKIINSFNIQSGLLWRKMQVFVHDDVPNSKRASVSMLNNYFYQGESWMCVAVIDNTLTIKCFKNIEFSVLIPCVTFRTKCETVFSFASLGK